MDSHQVVITDSDLPGDSGAQVLREAGFDVVVVDSRDPADLIGVARNADALIVQWAQIDDEIIAALPRLRVISRLGIGYDMIDVDAATRRGVAVANTPAYCIEEVATHSIALILGLTRGLHHYDSAVRAGAWEATAVRGVARPSATSVLVVGLGRIGSSVAHGLQGLGFEVLVHDPFVSAEQIAARGFSPVELPEGLARADVVTLHLPLNDETRHMLDAAAFASMRPGGFIVNTCRGGLISEDDLADAVRSGHLAGAGLDVFHDEPLPPEHPFRQVPGIVLTPHAAWYSPQSLRDLPLHAADNVIRFLGGEPVTAIVNPGYADAAVNREGEFA